MKNVVVTGASSGIGRATALLLDRCGYTVFAGVRRDEYADELRKAGSDRITPVQLDITVQEQVDAAAALVKDRVGDRGGLQGLVNNAGTAVFGCTEFCPMPEMRRQIEVNFIGQVAVTQAFAPLIRQGTGRFVFVSSANGHFALPYMGAYAASKFAIEALADAMRREFRPWRIPVVVVEPGTVEAKMWDTSPSVEDVLDRMSEQGRELHADRMRLFDVLMQKGRRCAARPEDIAAVIRKALEARRPRTRYQRGPGSLMAIAGSRLPDRLADWFVEGLLTGRLSSRLMGW